MSGHWADAYVGEAWVARDNDCWSFFRRVQRERFGRSVPEVDVDALSTLACVRALGGHDERANWSEVGEPVDGDAVLLGRNKRPSHVGVWAGDGVLHCVRGAGVVHQSMRSLRMDGWSNIALYRHA